MSDATGEEPTPHEQPPAAPRAPRRGRRWAIAAGILLVLAAWIGVAAVQLVGVAEHTRSGVDRLESLEGLASGDLQEFVDAVGVEGDDADVDATADSAIDGLRGAQADFSAATDRLDSPLLAPLRVLPVLGRQLRSVDALTAAAVELTDATASAVEALRAESDRDAGSAADRLAAAQRTAATVEELSRRLHDIDLGPSEALVAQLHDARRRFADEHARLVDTVDEAAVAVRGVTDFLEGPTTYLVLGLNNSEMRAGSGMPLQIGTLEVANGEMHLGEFLPTADLLLAQPGAVLDPDVQALWGWLQPNQEWRNVNVTARFDESARIASEMWADSGRGDVDGVMAVDVVGLQRLLELTGPVTVAGTESDPEPLDVAAETIVQQLLVDQYRGGDGDAYQAARRDRLGRVAGAVFEAINTRSVSVAQLIRVLESTGAGRHVMFWSDVPVQQAGWEALGAAGTLPENTLMLSLLNRAGNKLDQFVEIDATLTSSTDATMRRVTVTATLTNSAPDGLPRYIAGPFAAGLEAGDHLGILTLTMPAGAGNPAVSGARAVLAGPDGPTRVIGAEIRLPRGASTQVEVSFDLPVGWATVEVLPSARVPPVQWSAGTDTWTDDGPRSVELDGLG